MERAGCAQALWGPGGGLDDDDIAVLFTLTRRWIKAQRCGHLVTWRLLQLPGAM